MYAEERQQAMAQLIGQAGPAVGRPARRAPSTSPPRPCAATSPRWSVSDWCAACTEARCRRARSSVIESGLGERDQANTAAKDAIAAAAVAASSRRRARSSSSTPGRPPPGSPRSSPATTGSPSSPTRCPVAARLAGLPHIELHLLPGRVRPTTHAAVGTDTVAALGDLRADVAFVATNGLSADFGLTTPDRDEAATKRAIVGCRPAYGRARRLLQDRRRDLASGSPRSTTSTSWSPTADIDDDDRRRARDGRPGGRRRMIITLTANPSHDRTVALTEPLQRGAVQRAASVTSAGRRQGRQHLPRLGRRPACPTLAVLPAPEGRPVRPRAARGRHRLPPGRPSRATCASTSPSASPTAPPPSSTAPARR